MFLGPLKVFISTANFRWMSKVKSIAIKWNYLSMSERKDSENDYLIGILEKGAPSMPHPMLI